MLVQFWLSFKTSFAQYIVLVLLSGDRLLKKQFNHLQMYKHYQEFGMARQLENDVIF